MKKIILSVLFTCILLISNISFANYAAEFEKNYPDKVTVSKNQEGIASKYYDVYFKNNVGVSVFIDEKGTKYCALEYVYIGSEHRNYTAFKYGKGKKDYMLKFIDEPIVCELGSECVETFAADIDTRLLKKATYIAALRKDNKVDYLIPLDSPELKEFKKALKVAEKILSE